MLVSEPKPMTWRLAATMFLIPLLIPLFKWIKNRKNRNTPGNRENPDRTGRREDQPVT
jgi:hypothetical protein